MLAHLTSDKGEAIPITPVTRDGFTAWLVAAAESDRTWLKATGFAAEPGKVGLLPGPGGKLARILVGVAQRNFVLHGNRPPVRRHDPSQAAASAAC